MVGGDMVLDALSRGTQRGPLRGEIFTLSGLYSDVHPPAGGRRLDDYGQRRLSRNLRRDDPHAARREVYRALHNAYGQLRRSVALDAMLRRAAARIRSRRRGLCRHAAARARREGQMARLDGGRRQSGVSAVRMLLYVVVSRRRIYRARAAALRIGDRAERILVPPHA